MLNYYAVSPSRIVRMHCEGPLDAQHEKHKLEEEMVTMGFPLDVEIRIEIQKSLLRGCVPS